jgi:2-deoxy-D-gluconate 3-dehydrogenase
LDIFKGHGEFIYKIISMEQNILDKFSLKGKKAIVVGGAGDLGIAMVEAISEAGAQTVVIDYDDRVFDMCKDLVK